MAVALKGYAFNDAGGAVAATVETVGRTLSNIFTTTASGSTGEWSFAGMPDDIYDTEVEFGGKKVIIKGDAKIQIDSFISATGSTPIADGSITEGKLGTAAVTETKLGAGAVTAAKLGSGAVGTPALADASVTAAKLATGAVTAVKLAAAAVGTASIQDGAITQAKLAAGVGGGGSGVTDNSVYTNAIQNLAVTTGKIAGAAVGNGQLATGAVSFTKLADNAVTAAKLSTSAVTGLHIAGGLIQATHLASNAVTTAKLADGAVTAAKLAAGALAIENDGADSTLSTAVGIASASTGTNLVSITNLPAGDYLFIATVEVSFTGALSGIRAYLNIDGLDVLDTYAYIEGEAAMYNMMSYFLITTLGSTATVRLKARNTAFGNDILVRRLGTKLGYVRIS